MFSDKFGLTEAVLEGRKTQTRRVIHIAGTIDNINTGWFLEGKDKGCLFVADGNMIVAKSRYAVGEVVAVAQKYADFRMPNGDVTDGFYKLCCEHYMPLECLSSEAGATNKMFVKAELMPHHIRITNIRVERLQDISDEDCLAEGIFECIFEYENGMCLPEYSFDNETFCSDQRSAYIELINKVSGKGTWDSNPYVFVYEFELVD